MKKTPLLLATVLLFAVNAFAQSANVQDAYTNLKEERLKDALAAIEPALKDSQTSKQAQTWFYYTNICLEIANTKKSEYKDLLADPLSEALRGCTKTQELDEKNEYRDQIDFYGIAYSYFRRGVDAYEQYRYSDAADDFLKSYNIKEKNLSQTDTTPLFYAGYSYFLDKQYDNAEKIFLQLQDMDYQKPEIYLSLAKIAIEKEDYQKTIYWINEAEKKFPDNVILLQEKVNIYVVTEAENFKEDEVITTLEKLIQLDEQNSHIYYYNLGFFYTYKDADKAIEAYKKAIELKPDYTNAYINWANIYLEKYNEYVRQANELPIEEDKKYNELIEKSKELLNEALPYIEKSYELNKDDVDVKKMLRDLYIKLNMLDKAETIK